MGKTRKRSCFATDRISNLPCDVINNILKHLPLCDAVRTSVLSRVWRYNWVNVPHLVFDENFRQKLLGKSNIETIIYQILLLHKGAIVEFTLEFADNFHHAINHWFHFLSNHHIEKLKLQFSPLHIHHAMPYHLFMFDQLRHLHLANVHLKPPPKFKGFGRLVNLDLINVHITPGELRRFISKCPMLEYLNLHIYHQIELGDVEIDDPNLKSFHFRGILCSICFKNTSLLEKICIALDEDNAFKAFEELDGNLIEFFDQVSSIKRLQLDAGFMQFLSKGEVPQKLPNDLSRLKFLQLSDLDFSSIADVSCALCLIRSSPNLQNLQIITPLFLYDDDALPAAYYLKEQKKIGLTFSHLEYVKIVGFKGTEAELRFVKLILSAAITLWKLEIRSDYEGASPEGSIILKELAGFSRASPKAKIIFEYEDP